MIPVDNGSLLCPGDADHEGKRAQEYANCNGKVQQALNKNGRDHLPEIQVGFSPEQECPTRSHPAGMAGYYSAGSLH